MMKKETIMLVWHYPLPFAMHVPCIQIITTLMNVKKRADDFNTSKV